jgi:hypothetical protein
MIHKHIVKHIVKHISESKSGQTHQHILKHVVRIIVRTMFVLGIFWFQNSQHPHGGATHSLQCRCSQPNTEREGRAPPLPITSLQHRPRVSISREKPRPDHSPVPTPESTVVCLELSPLSPTRPTGVVPVPVSLDQAGPRSSLNAIARLVDTMQYS